MIPPGVDPDHAHGAPRKGDPGDRLWCGRCGEHRVQQAGELCPVCLDESADAQRRALRALVARLSRRA